MSSLAHQIELRLGQVDLTACHMTPTELQHWRLKTDQVVPAHVNPATPNAWRCNVIAGSSDSAQTQSDETALMTHDPHKVAALASEN